MRRPKRSPDRSKIAMDDADEVKQWCKHFGATPDEIQRAIEKVGNSAAAVRKELQLGNVKRTSPNRDPKK
jgi:Protein of unknown function (DUF3606)